MSTKKTLSPKKTPSVSAAKSASRSKSESKSKPTSESTSKSTSKSKPSSKSAAGAANELPVLAFETQKAWQRWLDANHATAAGVWCQFAKKGSGTKSVPRHEALDTALCYGWIDGQAKSLDANAYLQKFTPRRSRSIWSKINCDKVEALIKSGAMQPAGQAEIDRAKQDGRWAAAYAGPRTIEVPDDLQAALDRNRKAAAFFTTLSSRNRYAILFRIHNAKKADTRARRIEQFVSMLAKHETLYP